LDFLQKLEGEKEMPGLQPLPTPVIVYIIMSWNAVTYSLRVKLFASNQFPEFRALKLLYNLKISRKFSTSGG
jgi:hypothetical protein